MGFKLNLGSIFFFLFFLFALFSLFLCATILFILFSSSRFFVPFALLLSFHIASFILCCSTLLFVLLNSPFCATLFSSLPCWVLLLALFYSPLHTTRLSFSYCSTFLFALLRFFFCVVLFSSSH